MRKPAGRVDSTVVAGALAGLVGTAAMTVFMKPGLVRLLPPRWKPDEFVPLQVVQWGQEIAGDATRLSEPAEAGAAAAVHLAYGAAMGALYAVLREALDRPPAAALGAGWGVAVWAAGYQGWMPAAGVRPPTTHQPPTKWLVPVANHLVYGVATALAFEGLRDAPKRRRSLI
jgi:uncharacterized membrane protein YagU involved in acid resistance